MPVVIHGHFYQPPRVNPWTGLVPRQDAAAPAHDWNERIAAECYRPNARSRVMGSGNYIADIVNNYAHLSFDFGPTLLEWLAEHAPGVYTRVLAADRISRRQRGGHGNAIAQAYNHMILPLANDADRRTQILWGLRDFAHRFGRASESIWLPELGVNHATLELLPEHGIRYLILAPHQARRVRPLAGRGAWRDVSGGRVDPRRPYRCFLRGSRGRGSSERFIDIFFYDGPLAAEVSFGHLLRSSPALADRLLRAGDGLPAGGGLISVATDGEVYGHHEPFGDMCCAYLVRREGPARGIELTNYAAYLESHPPEEEVELDFGVDDAGTSWSCVHGVERWRADCGCSTGGPGEWNQAWRAVLRAGLDALRGELDTAFREATAGMLRDPAAARNDYIDILLDPRPEIRDAFLQRQAGGKLSAAERRTVWRLLEAQRYGMFMYTSCGWFFADISGVEPVQNLAFAARAIELARPWLAGEPEARLLEHLAAARSNLPEMGSGADVYRRFVDPQRVRVQAVAGELALAAAVLGQPPERELFRFDVVARQLARAPGGNVTPGGGSSSHGCLELVDRDTEEHHRFGVHVYQTNGAEARGYVIPLLASAAPGSGEASAAPPDEEELRHIEGVRRFTLADLPSENRERIIATAYRAVGERRERVLGELFDENQALMQTFREGGLPLPPILRAIAESVLSRRLEIAARELAGVLPQAFEERPGSPATPAAADDARGGALPERVAEIRERIAAILTLAKAQGIALPTQPLAEAYGQVIKGLLQTLCDEPAACVAEQCVAIIESSYPLHFPLDRRPLEDLAYGAFRRHRDLLRDSAERGTRDRRWQAFEALADALHLHIREILAAAGEED